eukprot:368107-Pyramimonas_sp.AAC.1
MQTGTQQRARQGAGERGEERSRDRNCCIQKENPTQEGWEKVWRCAGALAVPTPGLPAQLQPAAHPA